MVSKFSLHLFAYNFICLGASQSNDLGSISVYDSNALVAVKIHIKELLRYWIAHSQGIEVVPV